MLFNYKDKPLSGPRRVTESCFILLILFSVFLFVAIASHDSQDPSWSQTGFSTHTSNLVGRVGALISDVMLNFIGYGSYLFPLALLYLGFCILIKKFNIWELDWFTIGLRVVGFVFIFCSALVLISMNVLNAPSYNSGGIVGTILSTISISYFNELGTSLIYLALFLCGIPLFTGVSWLTICDVIGDLVYNAVFYRSIRDRRLAEEQLASLRSNSASREKEDPEESKYTTIDPKTGFVIYLRDDDEIRYAGSAYDDDDPPIIRNSEGQRKSVQPSDNGNAPQPEKSRDGSRIVDLTAQRAKANSSTGERVEPELNLDFAERRQNPSAAEPAVNPLRVNADAPKAETAPQNTSFAPSGTDAAGRTAPAAAGTAAATSSGVHAPAPAAAVKPASGSTGDGRRITVTFDSGRNAPAAVNMNSTGSSVAAKQASSPAAAPAGASAVRNTPSDPLEDDIDKFLDSIEPGSVLDQYDNENRTSGSDSGREFDFSIIHDVPEKLNGIPADTAESRSGNDYGDDDKSDFGFRTGEIDEQDEELQDEDWSADPSAASAPQGAQNRFISAADEQKLQNAPWAQSPDSGKDDAGQNEQSGTVRRRDENGMVEDARPFYPKYDEEVLKDTYDPEVLPGVDLLRNVPARTNEVPKEQLEQLGLLIEQKLKEFRIEAAVVGYEKGPVVTRFSLQLSPGTKVSTINNISRDLARELSAKSLRVIDIIPGTTYIGLEIPNAERTTIYFRELIDSDKFKESKAKLTCALGCDIVGQPVVMNLAKMPHLLVAGTTGSGKSVGVNGMILSMLYKATPDDLRLIMIDPKMLEFSSYNDIPHLLTEVVTDIKFAPNALRWCVGEMERRYKLMMKLGVKKIDEFNEKVVKAIEMGTPILDPLWNATDQLSNERPYLKKLPYIVVVIDELADMMMQVGKLVEELIARLAQKARAAGIHMIIATQSPRSDVLTGLIKSNIPSRVAFTVSNGMESRIILEQQGAECLLGNGDMLYSPTGSNNPIRVHGAYVSPEEIDRIVEFWKQQGEPQYVDTVLDDEITEENALPSEKAELEASRNANANDDLLPDAIRLILDNNSASASLLQRRLGVGFPRAGKIVDQLEDLGLISKPLNSAGKRNVFKDRCEAFLSSNGTDTGAINSFGDDGY